MSLVDQILGVESGGNPNARNPRSSAAGAAQFIDSTWVDMLARHRPDIKGTREELLALKMNPQISREMTAAYAAENGQTLARAGLPVTDGTSYLAHFAGPKGAVSLLTADPSAPVESILGNAAVAANPFLKGKTAADVVALANQKMGQAPVAAKIMQPSPNSASPTEQLTAQITGQSAPAQPEPQRQPIPAFTGASVPEHAQMPALQQPAYPDLASLLTQPSPPDPLPAPPRRRIDLAGLSAALKAPTSRGLF